MSSQIVTRGEQTYTNYELKYIKYSNGLIKYFGTIIKTSSSWLSFSVTLPLSFTDIKYAISVISGVSNYSAYDHQCTVSSKTVNSFTIYGLGNTGANVGSFIIEGY